MSTVDSLVFDQLHIRDNHHHHHKKQQQSKQWSDASNPNSLPRQQSTSKSSSNDNSPYVSRNDINNINSENTTNNMHTGGIQAIVMNDNSNISNKQSKYSFDNQSSSTTITSQYTLQSIQQLCPSVMQQFDIQLYTLNDVQHSNVLLDVLTNETCALCLQQYSTNTTEQYCTLTCKLLQCTHIVHTECLVQTGNNPAMPVLDSMHATSFFRVVPCTQSNFIPSSNTTNQHTTSRYDYALGVTHYTSNAQLLHAQWNSIIPTSTETNHVCMLQPSTASIQSLYSEQSNELCINILRGRIIFKCSDDTTQSQIYHMCNYDISGAKQCEYIHLVLVDTRSRNVLTIGLKQFTIHNDIWYNIVFVRYELSVNQSYQPVPVQPTQINTMKSNSNNVQSIQNNASNINKSSTTLAHNSDSTPSQSPSFQPLLPSDLIDPVKLPSASELAYSRNAADLAATNNANMYMTDQLRSYTPVPVNTYNTQQQPSRQSISHNNHRISNIQHRDNYIDQPNLYNNIDYSQQYTDDYDSRHNGRQHHHRTNIQPHTSHHHDHPQDDNPLYLPALPTAASVLGSMTQVPILELTLDQCINNVVRLCKSHSGSRFIQQKLDQHDTEYFELFFNEMQTSIAELMVDNFAHFAIEKLFQQCSDEQLLYLLQHVSPQLSYIACQKHGSFSVQALVDTVHTHEQIQCVCQALQNDANRLITHASGHFVLLRILQKFDVQYTRFIDDAVTIGCGSIGTDHHGLRVIKAVLAVRRPNELSKLFKQASRLTMKLVENQYGNYLIQSILDCAPPAVRTNIKVKMEGKFMRLSKQKFSSNVVEKCLKQSSAHWRNIIIRELIAQPAVGELLRDRYGNFVIQCSLTVANTQQIQEISTAITPYLHTLRDNVKSKWHRLLHKAESNGFMREQQQQQQNLSGQQNNGRDSANQSPTLSLADSEPNSPSTQHTQSQPNYNIQRQSFQSHQANNGNVNNTNYLTKQSLNDRIDLNQSHMIYQNLPYY